MNPTLCFFMNEANNHAGLHGTQMQTTVYCIPLHTMEIICFYNMWTYGAKECFKRISFSILFHQGNVIAFCEGTVQAHET